MAAYTLQTTSLAGVAHTLTAVAASDTFLNDGRTMLVVKNGSGSPLVVTVTVQAKHRGLTITNPTATVAAGATAFLGPYAPDLFNASTGSVTVAYDATTTITAAAVQMGSI
jgi:hypothetical protein